MRFRDLTFLALALAPSLTRSQRYTGADGKIRIALAQQPFSPTGTSVGPATMANGGIQQLLVSMGATVKVEQVALTPAEDVEYGAWKRLGRGLSGLLATLRLLESGDCWAICMAMGR